MKKKTGFEWIFIQENKVDSILPAFNKATLHFGGHTNLWKKDFVLICLTSGIYMDIPLGTFTFVLSF